jgi:uncharacterized OB-fold protein
MNTRSTPTPVTDHYWLSLEAGRLTFQNCACGHCWLPPRSECPSCLGTDWSWRDASGRAKLISWVVYFIAYDESFQKKIPYNVAIVELEEGVRLISNITDCPDGKGLERDMHLELAIEHEGDVVLARFARIPPREII